MSKSPNSAKALLTSPPAIAAFISLISFSAFLRTLRNGFVPSWDDGRNLIDNPNFRGLAWPQLRWMWTNHLMDHYVPLAWTTFGVDYTMWKLNPFGYHLTNIVFHALNAGLFFFLTLAVLRLSLPKELCHKGSLIAGSAFSALVFALHPLRVESVAWATERRDVLCGFFYLLALLAYLRPYSAPGTKPSVKADYWVSFGFFVAAVLSKEMAVTLPVILLILDVYPLRRLSLAPGGLAQSKRVLLEKVPFFAVSLADGAMTFYVAMKSHLPDPLSALGWIPRFGITIYGMSFYILKTLSPVRLSPLYPVTGYKIDPRGWPFLISLACVLGVSAAAWILRRRVPGLLAVWLAYTVILLPVGGLVHNGSQIAADRYTYLSCLGWAILAGAAIVWFLQPGVRFAAAVGLAALAAVVLGALAWQTQSQIAIWRDPETLWDRAVRINPDSPAALGNLGTELYHSGDLLGAEDCYRRAIAIAPAFVKAHGDLASILLHERRVDEAIREYQIIQQLVPASPEAYTGMGNALLMGRQINAAIAQYRRALQLQPGYEVARDNLRTAIALSQQSPRNP